MTPVFVVKMETSAFNHGVAYDVVQYLRHCQVVTRLLLSVDENVLAVCILSGLISLG
jgi:hypothetical protein